MEQRLKQRLVGAVVLVALAVIFIPMILQGPIEREVTSVPAEIPAQPAVNAPSQSVPESMPSAAVSPTPAEPQPMDEAPAQSSAATDQPPPAPPKPAAASREVPPELAAWAVQVGSFGTEANALKLRDDLRAKGYAAYTETTRSDDKTLYRVRVGPTVERGEAERLQQELAGKESLKGLVISHP